MTEETARVLAALENAMPDGAAVRIGRPEAEARWSRSRSGRRAGSPIRLIMRPARTAIFCGRRLRTRIITDICIHRSSL